MQHLKRLHPLQIQKENLPPNEAMEVDEVRDTPAATNNLPSCSKTSSSTLPSSNISSESLPSCSKSVVTSNISGRRSKQMKLYASSNELSRAKIAEIEKKLLLMIVSDFQPLSIVENTGFLQYTKALNPLYSPPNRKILANEILPKAYNESAVALKTILNEIKYTAITTDMWTSDNNIGYITVTCHYIWDSILFSRVLATQDATLIMSTPSHTSKNLAEAITTILNEWNVYNKTATVVSDNAANIKCAINDHLKMHHHPCVAHTLNLSVNEALKDSALMELLKKCKSIVGYFKHSVQGSEKLKLTQQQMGLPILKVKQDVATRWNSCLHMLRRLLEIKDALSVAMASLPNAPDILSANEWKVLEDCVQVLKPAEDMSTTLSAEKYPTLSLVIPLFHGFEYTIKQTTPSTEIGKSLQLKILEVVTRRLGGYESNKTVAKSTFLDPRFKKIGFGSEDNANNAQKWITEELSQNILSNQTMAHSTLESANSESLNLHASTEGIWAHFDSKVTNIKSHSTPGSLLILMVRQYLEMQPLPRTENPLEWWRRYKTTLPEMYDLATKYLCIPATSVPSERNFSKAGQLTCSRRNRLGSKNVDKIIFLNSALSS
ncbi:zinc finger BED domain-containing protein 1-like [Sitophilus oryzae]|uniref:Zinc finger BED domain-containing protein 1-like n=1 Tax=Sitophilus oryzae TaxID=7048 RepID=A0A6J2YLP5_SITOR|nr:zinc finger BED domain-containing protein 1-like [Sitophilus oryzae]